MQHIIPISGKDSLSTAIIQKTRQPELEYSYFYNDTGSELPETINWLNSIEKKLGIEIIHVGSNLEDVIYEQGILPGHKTRFCTRLSKIYPMLEMLGDTPTTLYYGLRADEPERIGFEPIKGKTIVPVYPLRETNMGINEVFALLDNLDLVPPTFFWPELKELVKEELGLFGYLADNLNRVEAIQLYSWRSRPNCYFCFYQRLYEWVGLYEFHPDLFDKARLIEVEVGSAEFTDRDKDYTWRADGPLTKVLTRAYAIKRKRAREVARLILKKNFGVAKVKDILPETKIDFELKEEIATIEITSCGLLCGK